VNEPIDRELFERTAPQWNCVDFPGDGMHYLSPGGVCQWCGVFVCPRCGKASSHPDDIREGYCGACHDWTGRRR
jgi:hypothetical protein